ncbi:MAG TPA: YfhO family protein, partial [Geomonas sp.]
SDVITQFFWGAKAIKEQSLLKFLQAFPGVFHADWDTLSDGGRTLEGGWNAIGLLFHRYLIQHFFPFPSSIAWLAVLAMCWGAAGTFKYCRLIGIGRFGAFTAGLIYVLCTENASLINAGHIQKLEAICWFPWVLLFLEKALKGGRLFYYALTALMLAIQFFHMHWQISFYTCLAVGAYCVFHAGARFLAEKGAYARPFGKELLLVAVMVLLFFTTIAMSFAPLYSWSRQSERGDAVSGSATAGSGAANTGEGIGYDEGMSWSLPPEEILTYLVPGLFGFSRQEGGDVPAPGQTYYWGRMRFTQTGDYLGLLPWFLIPLPLLFRRDRYTWFFTFLIGATLIMALGKYTFVYRFMFEHLPAFSKFRVPKMILFLFAFGVSVLAGRGIDILAQGTAERKKLAAWVGWCGALVALTGLLWVGTRLAGQTVADLMGEYISAPTRYQSGNQLVDERYSFMLREGRIAFTIACLYFAAFFAWYKKWLPSRFLVPLLVLFLLGDLWRVNDRYFVLTAPPQANKSKAKSDVVTFLEGRIDHYRMQPMGDENAHYYADYGFANISAYVTISERRYKEFLEGLTLTSAMPDLMNLKYLVMPSADYQSQKGALAGKYAPAFTSSSGSVVLENSTVLPKAWLVPSVALVTEPQQRVGIMSGDPNFKPALVALVESPPPLQLAPYPGPATSAGIARLDSYETNRIKVTATATANALLVLGEKYYKGWSAKVDGKRAEIVPVDHILRGVYLTPGTHTVEFVFDPLPFKVGKYLSLASFAFLAFMLGRELWVRRRLGTGGLVD